MRNHDEKVKDISRSVLPSTGRKGARDARRIIHKRQRTRELAGLTEYRRTADPDDETPDFRGKAAPEITQMVRRRRASDKIGPLVRWAQATIAADPRLRSASRTEQVAYFARLMPATRIGEHAVKHIEWELEWRDRRASSSSTRIATARSALAVATERQVHQILAAGLHGTLNLELRHAAERQVGWPPARRPMPRRPLLGAHDAKAFADEMASYSDALAVIASVAALAKRTPKHESISECGMRMSRVAENKKVEVAAQFNRYIALFRMENYPQALEVIRSAVAWSADEAVPPHERGQLLAALADALRAAGHPEQERRAVLQAAADAFDEAGLPALSQMFRDPQATPPTPKRKTFSSKDQVQQRPGDEQDKG